MNGLMKQVACCKMERSDEPKKKKRGRGYTKPLLCKKALKKLNKRR